MTEITYKGANYITVQTKQGMIIIDPALPGTTLPKAASKANVQLITQPEFMQNGIEGQLIFTKPGEYEAVDTSIIAIDAAAQIDPTKKSVVYKITTPDCSIAIIGHVNPDKIDDDQLEQLGLVDILIVPVGGNGYTVDPHGAIKLTKRISPKIVVPVHFKEDDLEYEVPQQSVQEFIGELGLPAQNEPSLKIKQPSQLPETLTLVVLQK